MYVGESFDGLDVAEAKEFAASWLPAWTGAILNGSRPLHGRRLLQRSGRPQGVPGKDALL
jgi:hypothetical protein